MPLSNTEVAYADLLMLNTRNKLLFTAFIMLAEAVFPMQMLSSQ